MLVAGKVVLVAGQQYRAVGVESALARVYARLPYRQREDNNRLLGRLGVIVSCGHSANPVRP